MRIAAEACVPQRIADHYYRFAGRLPFVLGESAAQLRSHAQNCKEVRRHSCYRHLLRFTMTGKVERIVGKYSQAGEGTVPGPHQIVAVQSKATGIVIATPLGIEQHQLLWIPIGESLQQERIDYGKDCGVSADAQGQGDDGGKAESRTFQPPARAVAQ